MNRAEAWIRLFRAHHWIKNTFVLAPLLFAGLAFERDSWLHALIAFAQFCIAASAVYIFNDLRDLAADRLHPVKSVRRPLAAGVISPKTAWIALLALLLGFIAAFMLLRASGYVVLAYVALNIAYSLYLKRVAILDIFTVALGFVLRVYAGAVAIAVPVSGWMFVTVLSLALFLATLKRRQEVVSSGTEAREVLRAYTPALLDRYAQTAAIGALVFYCLYVISSNAALIGTVPVVLFGLFRYWYVVEMHDRGESPTEVLYKDPWLAGAVLVWGIAVAAVIHLEEIGNVV